MNMSRRWAIALTSDDEIDLKIAREIFKIGEPSVGEITVSATGRVVTVLFSEQLDKLSAASDVADASERFIDAINGICLINDEARSPLQAGAVHARLASGGWDGGTVFASVDFHMTSRITAFALVVGEDGKILPDPQSRQSMWLQTAMMDQNAIDVLTYLRGTPDWFLLYKAYEAMRADGGPAAGWPDTNRFSRSANIHRHFAGHSAAKQTPDKPFVPMQLNEAIGFVRSLARLWLDSKV